MTLHPTLPVRRFFQSNWSLVVVLSIIATHVALLIHGASIHFPNIDEIAHLPSGVSHWEFERFDLYRVNPPLVRLVASFPAWLVGVEYDWGYYVDDVGLRPEFVIGNDRVRRLGLGSVNDFCFPRLFCLFFTLIGITALVYWVRTTLGVASGVLTATYWCCCPNMLAHAQTIIPDVGCLSVGILACYLSWRYFLKPSIFSASFAGIGLGMALLTKLTWVTGFLSLPLAIVLSCLLFHREKPVRPLYHRALDGFLFVVIALLVLNAGYLFEGFGKELGEYEFCSEMLGGPGTSSKNVGNRFKGSWLEQVPVPVPKNFLLGIDFLRQEVEEKKWSFLLGEWKHGSWPHYYVVTTLLKTPEGMLMGALFGGIWWLVIAFRVRWNPMLCPS